MPRPRSGAAIRRGNRAVRVRNQRAEEMKVLRSLCFCASPVLLALPVASASADDPVTGCPPMTLPVERVEDPPSQYRAYCERLPNACDMAGPTTITLDEERQRELSDVNARVNRDVVFVSNMDNLGLEEDWSLPLDGGGGLRRLRTGETRRACPVGLGPQRADPGDCLSRGRVLPARGSACGDRPWHMGSGQSPRQGRVLRCTAIRVLATGTSRRELDPISPLRTSATSQSGRGTAAASLGAQSGHRVALRRDGAGRDLTGHKRGVSRMSIDPRHRLRLRFQLGPPA